MGPSGCGKSTVGRLAAARSKASFVEADDHHTDEARERMHAGLPLTDDDRIPWIARVANAANAANAARGGRVVIACSALSERVRDALSSRLCFPVRFVLLDVPTSELARRLTSRLGHFAGANLLDSQLETLALSGTTRIDGMQPPEAIAATVARMLTDGDGD